MSKASKKMLRQQRLITQIKQSNGRGVWLNAEQLAALDEKDKAQEYVLTSLKARIDRIRKGA